MVFAKRGGQRAYGGSGKRAAEHFERGSWAEKARVVRVRADGGTNDSEEGGVEEGGRRGKAREGDVKRGERRLRERRRRERGGGSRVRRRFRSKGGHGSKQL